MTDEPLISEGQLVQLIEAALEARPHTIEEIERLHAWAAKAVIDYSMWELVKRGEGAVFIDDAGKLTFGLRDRLNQPSTTPTHRRTHE